MSNFNISLDLLRLQGAFTRNLKGKTAMFLGEKGCYLNAVAYETQDNQYGDTHMVKPDLPKEVRERMTEDERRNQPILGNMRPMQPQGGTVSGTMQASDFANDHGDDNDLPF